MEKNLTTIRGRILELVKKQGFQVSKFFNEVGDNYENFKGNKLNISPNTDILVKIRTKIPEANIDWILTGEGEMLVKNEGNFAFVEKILEKFSDVVDAHKDEHNIIIGQNGKIVEQNGAIVKQNSEILSQNAEVIKQNSELMRQNAEAMAIIQKLSEKLK